MSGAIEKADSTFSLAREVEALFEGYDPDTGEYPEDFDQRMSALALRVEDKLDGCAYYTRRLSNTATMLRDEAARLTERARMFERREKRIKDGMMFLLAECDRRKIETQRNTVYVQKNPARLEVADVGAVPSEYVEIVQETRIDKRAIKEAIKGGKDVPGCKLVQSHGVRIK